MRLEKKKVSNGLDLFYLLFANDKVSPLFRKRFSSILAKDSSQIGALYSLNFQV